MAHADALDVGARVTKLIEDGNNESEGTGTATDEQRTGRYTHVVTFDNGDVENFTLKQLRERCTLVVPAPVVNNNLEAATTRQRDDDTTGKEEVPSLGKRKVASLFSEQEEVPDVLLPMLDAARLTQPPPQVQKRGPGTPRKAPPPPPSPPPPMPSPIPPQPPEPSGKNLLQAAAQLTPQPSPAVAQAAAELTPLGMGMMGIGSNHIDDVIVIDLEVEDSEDVRARPSRACARPSRRTIVDDMVDLDDDHRLAFYQNDDETVAKGKEAAMRSEDAAPTPNAGTSGAAKYRGVYPSRCSSGTFFAGLKVNNVSVHLCKSDDATKLALIRDYVIRECNLTNARNFDDATALPREYLEEATAAVVKTKGYQKAGNVPPPPPYQNDDATVAKGKAAMRSEDAAPTPNAGTSDAAKYRGVYKYPNRQELFYYAQVSRNNKGCHIGNSKDATKLALIRDYVIRECNLTTARNFDDATTLPREYLEEATAAVVKTKRCLDSGNVPPPPSYQEAEKHAKKKTLSKGVPFSCKGVGTLSSMIGRRVTKKFGDRFYNGVVDGCEGTMRWYHITYDDGDAEDIAFTEFLELTHGPDINNAFFTAKGAEQVSRVLGCTFATETAKSVWDACWSRAKKQRQDPKMLPGIGGFEVKSFYDADHPSCLSSANLFESISKYLTDLGFDVGACVYHGATPMLPLNAPHHLNLEEYVVAADDPREGLRGQKGCRVKPDGQPIAAGTTLGVYGGQLLMSGEVHELKSVKDSVQGGILCFLRAELQAECFTEEFNHFNYEQGEEIPLDGEKLTVCAVDVNDNLMHRINDVRISPLSKKSEMLPGGANVEYVETCVCGFPFVFLVARQDLAPSQDLRGNYGDAYWHMVREYVSRIKVCIEAATFNQ
ncbi:hypothetical protein PPROV_000486400 [Pycnococcus provasolii]|uniref:PTM/DIR17-like Tudor domain-containing protein n=1 Tax=Pycnococcus provasolii TaxID=41880 RepID=A0A830HM57_9CHLO|nr:hypothetical protein PPROV_000486400 [Pycnococcus provasolii]